MTENLSKRFFTSVILSTVLLIALFSHKYFWLILLLVASAISLIEFNNLSKKIWKKNKIVKYFINTVSYIYLVFFIYSAFKIYILGINFTIFIILICVFSDIGGSVFGKTIGGKKLTKISPNKTISGSVGSFIFSFTPIIIFITISSFSNNSEFEIYLSDFPKILYVCLFVSLINQLGDLFISFFKRKAKVKDTGSILPGHGGLLDRIDGMIFSLPISYLIFKIFY